MERKGDGLTLQEVFEADKIRIMLDSDSSYSKYKEDLKNYGISDDTYISDTLESETDGFIYGFLAEIIQRIPSQSSKWGMLLDIFDAIDFDDIASVDLIMLKAYYHFNKNELDQNLDTLRDLKKLDFEDSSDSRLFYQILAHSPYRRLMIMEGFLYKAYRLRKLGNQSEEELTTLMQLLKIIEETGALGFSESDFINQPVEIDFIEAEILKYFYQTLLEVAMEEDEFVPIVKRVKEHIFLRNLMYNSDLRKFIFELSLNQEILYVTKHQDDPDTRNDAQKILKNNDGFLKRLEKQLQDFPNAPNILRPSQHLIQTYQSVENMGEKLDILQQIVLNLIKHDTFEKLTNISAEHDAKVETFTQGELDKYRFFFSGSRSKIITGSLFCKDTYYTLGPEYLHNYYSECLDLDPANGEYIYNLIKTYYAKHEYSN